MWAKFGKSPSPTDPTSTPIVLDPSESVSFHLTRSPQHRHQDGKPLTTSLPTFETERDGTKRNEPDCNRLKRKSIRPKRAVTVGFEPKEVRSSSFVLSRKARIHADWSLSHSGLGPVQSVSITHRCGWNVGTAPDVRRTTTQTPDRQIPRGCEMEPAPLPGHLS